MEMKPKNRPMLRNGQTPPARPSLTNWSRPANKPTAKLGGCKSCRGGR